MYIILIRYCRLKLFKLRRNYKLLSCLYIAISSGFQETGYEHMYTYLPMQSLLCVQRVLEAIAVPSSIGSQNHFSSTVYT